MKKPLVILWDFDDTIYDIKSGKLNDLPFALAKMVRNMPIHSILLTHRPESMRQETEHWLYNHRLFFKQIIMRDDDDVRSAGEFKAYIINNLILPKYDVLGMIDNDEQVVEALNKIGIDMLYYKKSSI